MANEVYKAEILCPRLDISRSRGQSRLAKRACVKECDTKKYGLGKREKGLPQATTRQVGVVESERVMWAAVTE